MSTTNARCDKCKRTTKKNIKEEIKYSSETIIVHLKRFKERNGSYQKVKTAVKPTRVSIDVNGKRVDYDVSGVISHIGNLHSGHYNYQHHMKNGLWINFNDGEVIPSSIPTDGYIYILNKHLPEEGKVRIL